MGTFSISHWLIVLLVFLLVFGPKKISELGKGLGQGLRNFRTGLSEDDTAADRLPEASTVKSADAGEQGVVAMETKPDATTRAGPTAGPAGTQASNEPAAGPGRSV
jgi:sec-independent protein translocase protein TatA